MPIQPKANLCELYMSARELRNLISDLQLTESTETTEREKRAATRNQIRETKMEEDKLPTIKPKGESTTKSFGFENRETFVVKQKATKEELAARDSVSLIKYLLNLQANIPPDRKEYEMTFLRDCLPHMETIERYIQMYIADFEDISKKNIELKANMASDEAAALVESTKNLNARVKQFRNSDIQKLIEDLVKNSNKMEETQLKEKDTPSGWIIKRKIHNFHDENNKLLDQILFQNQLVSRGAQEIYNKITTPKKGYSFKPLDNTKPKVLSLSSMKNDWETLSNWEKKLKEYIQSGHQDPEANQHTPAVRTILKSFLDKNIRQRTERNLDLANTVDELFGILEKEEQIFWPLDKRLKSFFASTRKSSDDPRGFLAELCKKAKFCKVSTIIDDCIRCNHCDSMVKVDPDDETAIKKIIIQALFRGVNDNPFLAYITDETGGTN